MALEARSGRSLVGWFPFFVFLCVALVGLGACNTKKAPQVGDMAPDFALEDLEGELRRLSDFRGRVVLINFWATWCPPCVDEMPSLQKLHDALSDKGLVVLAVSVDERYSDIEEFVGTFQLRFPIVHDAGKRTSREFQTFRYPESFIVDRDGRIRSKVIGARDWVAPTVIRDFVALLSEPETGEREPPPPGATSTTEDRS
jgi:peroxiredoxin